MIQIRHEIFEASTGYAYPVVTHLFTGKTLVEAKNYFHAHLLNDRFFRACAAQPGEHLFDGRVRCRSRVRVSEVPDLG